MPWHQRWQFDAQPKKRRFDKGGNRGILLALWPPLAATAIRAASGAHISNGRRPVVKVRKGEKGDDVVFWKELRRALSAKHNPMMTSAKARARFFRRGYCVFNAKPSDGYDRTMLPHLPETERIARARPSSPR